MKKVFALLLALVMVLSLAACGGSAAPAQETAPAKEEQAAQPAAEKPEEKPAESSAAEAAVSGSRLEAFVAKYIASDEGWTMVYKIDGTDGTAAYKDDNMYMTFQSEEGSAIIIKNDTAMYLLMAEQKMGIKIDAVPEGRENPAEEMEASGEFTTGEMEMAGKSYYYEEYNEEDGTARYLFDGDMLRYIVTTAGGQTESMEVVSVEKGVDDSLFQVPSGCQIYG